MPPIAAGGEGKAKLTSLASETGLPKLDGESEPPATEDPGEPVERGHLLRLKILCHGSPRWHLSSQGHHVEMQKLVERGD